MTCRCMVSAGYWVRAVCRPLTDVEMAVVGAVALARHEASWRRRDRDALYLKTDPDEDLQVHLLGATGEAAYSILFDVPWPMGVDTHHAPDIEPDIEVRCRKSVGRRLIIRDGADPDRRYVAAAVLPDGLIQFDGWCWGDEGLTHPIEDPRGYRPAHFIAITDLHRFPMTLRHERGGAAVSR